MKAFLSIKFFGDDRNRGDVEELCNRLENLGLLVFCFRRDSELWGENQYSPSEMMERTFKEIEKADLVVVNIADWPIGVGVEAGYAYAKGKPIICIVPVSSKIANTVAGLAVDTIQYQNYIDFETQMKVFLDKYEISNNS